MEYALDWNPTQGEWQRCYDEAGIATAYQQHWAYGTVVERFGAHIQRVIIRAGGKPVGLLQLQQKRWLRCLTLAIAMRGPVWLAAAPPLDEQAALFRRIKREAQLKFPAALLFMPELEVAQGDAPPSLPGMHRVISGYSTIMLDLAATQEELLANMEGKWRNRMRGGEKNGVTSHKVGQRIDQYGWLLEREEQQRRRIGYAALSPLLVPLWQEEAGKDSLLTLRAEHDGEVVAGMLCLLHGQTATYHIGWNSDEGRGVGAHNLLLWELMCALKRRHIRWLDLGGVNTEDGAGIARFKLGSGGKLVSLAGSYI